MTRLHKVYTTIKCRNTAKHQHSIFLQKYINKRSWISTWAYSCTRRRVKAFPYISETNGACVLPCVASDILRWFRLLQWHSPECRISCRGWYYFKSKIKSTMTESHSSATPYRAILTGSRFVKPVVIRRVNRSRNSVIRDHLKSDRSWKPTPESLRWAIIWGRQ